MSRLRSLLFLAVAVLGGHYILSAMHLDLSFGIPWPPASSPSLNLTSGCKLPDQTNSTVNLEQRKANATFVMLARNIDVDATVQSIREMEDRFNVKYHYPYVLLNDEVFTDEFKRVQPDWIDEVRATNGRDQLVRENVIYGGSVSYRNMCRFNSGFFFRHPLVLPYRWYWRIEPGVHFHCNLRFDPFIYMEERDKVYGFTITMYEYHKTIPTLWGHVRDFMKLHPEYVASDNAMGFMSDDGGETYNLCHFWSNFEIADMEFWRSPAYTDFFEYLESKGGFYYERWGDAPVHSIAAGIFANKDQIQLFSEKNTSLIARWGLTFIYLGLAKGVELGGVTPPC
ncbi:glycosyltransferase family 15 protein [Mycena filopes]|nr:glycosyltransferase family 15 protein [Mycena filopes]